MRIVPNLAFFQLPHSKLSSISSIHPFFLSIMSDQAQRTKDATAQKAEETKEYGQQKTGEAQQHAQGMTQAAKDNASAAAQTAQEQAAEGKEKTGNMLQQAGDAVKNAANKVTGGNAH